MSDVPDFARDPNAPVPAHVPDELVRDINLLNGPGIAKRPFETLTTLHEGPRTVYNTGEPMRGGYWMPTRAADIRDILQDPETFSSRGMAGFSALVGETWPLIPAELDPPVHSDFRTLLNPLFSPKAIASLEPRVEQRAVELIDKLVGQKGCEFMSAFGRAFPVSIFLEIMGLPIENVELFSGWMDDILHSPDVDQRRAAMREVISYLREVAKARADQSGGDVISIVVNGKVQGRALTDDEIIGTLTLVFGGGIDTVANVLGFFFKHLAEDPELQARLRADPSLIRSAVEELLRRYSIVVPHRQVTRDVEAAGVQMKAGDWIEVVTSLASLDPDEFAEPLAVRTERSPNRHLAFSSGPHRCVGAHLARRELAVAMERWLKHLPPFRLAPGEAYQCHGGLFGVDFLHLVWD
ncbi:MAG: cytochrome [Phenylobacterium sp.]|uniref:cytochrome P450 n=1 Tax=Phenylobacterium sp. TaxID=1871053 RepID=UPI002606E799|nr:cytochrome P450 [Phenylobacterium sp.]MDB5497295.1 cytochrome [Phenylobacterium sp.]